MRLALQTENRQTKDKRMPESACPVVNEDDTCPHWERRGDESITPMRECWYCKHSDFRKDIIEHKTSSICHRPINQSNVEEER